MKIFKSKHKLQKEILNIKNISFVPTMGGLHKGHESLIKKSKKYGCKSLVTIFVNPKQFDKKEDFQSYPRNIKKDIQVLKSLNVDFIYLPKIKDIFSFRTKNEVFLDQFSKKLCGKSRKGHFEGVLNVVNRLLEIIKPKYMLLGNKDFQQLHLLDKHIKRRKIITKIISCKTIREINGIACSTRNSKMTKKQLNIASKVYWYLSFKKKIIKKNIKYFDVTCFKKDLMQFGLTKIDYLEVYNLKTLKKPKGKNEKFKIFIAYFLKKIRLIDNI